MTNYEYAPPQKKIFFVENDTNIVVSFLKKFGQELQVKVIDTSDEALELLKRAMLLML